jgi:hypothetical protein
MHRITPRSSINHLELNHGVLSGKLTTYLQVKQRGGRSESSIAQKPDMMCFYISDDVENDVRRCIRSWEHQRPISVNGRAVTGEIKCFSGTVEAVARAPSLATGELWLVTMRELKPTPD